MESVKKGSWSRLLIFFIFYLMLYLIVGSVIAQLFGVPHNLLTITTQTLVIGYGLIFGHVIINRKISFIPNKSQVLRSFPLFLFTLVPMVTDLLFSSQNRMNFPEFSKALPSAIFAGVSEELILRGIILVALINLFRDRRYSNLISINLSSMVFALLHLLNLFSSSSSFTMTVGQVIYAYMLGVFLSVLFISSGSLLMPIISHILIDSTAFLEHDLPMSNLVLFILMYGLIPMVAALILKKEELLQNFNQKNQP
ncbi:CPBP family intramembrane metalloprotease [Weissella muntiaci]|uniref:CPBP family intramembrane metalloprotease n=1 Tax=Weissella muntiaci TaxID=2508881 RepID=A0A6C2C968_9LACO|nr:CPBP family intramembrane glutamic endopeptidase [Weissella muntiaci]TYC50538.1 CPBP family intramembrane metalloprotease [Weissella muntiaci]